MKTGVCLLIAFWQWLRAACAAAMHKRRRSYPRSLPRRLRGMAFLHHSLGVEMAFLCRRLAGQTVGFSNSFHQLHSYTHNQLQVHVAIGRNSSCRKHDWKLIWASLITGSYTVCTTRGCQGALDTNGIEDFHQFYKALIKICHHTTRHGTL